MIARNGLTFALDTPEAVAIDSRDCLLHGWCFSNDRSDSFEINLRVDGVKSQVFLGFQRTDVAEHFHNPSLELCGFLARFRRPHKGQSAALFGQMHGIEFPLIENIPIPDAATAMSAPKITSYERWLLANEPGLFWNEDEIADRLSLLDYLPLISIILPTFNTPRYFLQRCIGSVLDQFYPNWQLCIADDQSAGKEVIGVCQEYSNKDGRITIDQCPQQGGISVASNVALKNATGEFVTFLDHDDELHPAALVEIARALNSFPGSQLLYSDEDKIDLSGLRSQPAFKPDFDKNIFMSFNYLGHLAALRRSVVTEIGGFRPSCDGAQDWDLLIRATETVSPQAIRHVRKPLYHWRMHAQSTSMNLDAKPYVSKAWARVLDDHVTRTAKNVTVTEGLFHGSMRIKYDAPKPIEIGVFLRPEDGAFQSAVVQTNAGCRVMHLYQTLEGIIFEMQVEGRAALSASAGGGMSRVRSSSICSLTEAKGDLFIFINGPLESVNHLFFEELVAQGMRDDCGLVTGLSLDPENRILSSGFVAAGDDELVDPYVGTVFPNHGYMGQLSVVRAIDACPETFFAVRRQYLAEVGGLGAIPSSHMHRLARMLSKNASDRGLSILFTPYAVATFSERYKLQSQEALGRGPSEPVRLNPQLLSFEHSGRRPVHAKLY